MIFSRATPAQRDSTRRLRERVKALAQLNGRSNALANIDLARLSAAQLRNLLRTLVVLSDCDEMTVGSR